MYEASRPNWMIVQGVAQALLGQLQPEPVAIGAAVAGGSGGQYLSRDVKGSVAVASLSEEATFWDYLTVGEITSEIAERVPGYAGITPTALARTGQQGTWGRQTNEAIYYDGTNYENTEGIGIQYPAPAEQPKATLNVAPLPFELVVTDAQYPFLLLVQRVLYDADPLLRDSRLLNHVPDPFVALNTTDAQRLGIKRGDTVRVASAAGAIELPARVVVDLDTGSVLIPANLPGAPLDAVQTGPRTRVTVSKVM